MSTKKSPFLLIAVIAAVLVLAAAAGIFGLPYVKDIIGGATEPSTTEADAATTSTAASTGAVTSTGAATTTAPAGTVYQAEGLAWAVKPELPHKTMYYCEGQYGLSHEGKTIDKKTGKLTKEDFHSGHGGNTNWAFFYDEKRDLYGYYRMSEYQPEYEMLKRNKFDDKFDGAMRAFCKIDSSKVTEDTPPNDIDGRTFYDLSNAVTEKFAAAYGTTFVSDFVYDFPPMKRGLGLRWHSSADLIALSKDGKWGALYKDGKTALPFVFEDILLIYEDNNNDYARTAFAKYKGKYGIIDIAKTAALHGVTLEAVTKKVPDSPGEYRVATENGLPLRLREGPGTNFEFIINIPDKTKLFIEEISNGWGKTTYDKKTGWVSLEFLGW